jgi:hypothetical protein
MKKSSYLLTTRGPIFYFAPGPKKTWRLPCPRSHFPLPNARHGTAAFFRKGAGTAGQGSNRTALAAVAPRVDHHQRFLYSQTTRRPADSSTIHPLFLPRNPTDRGKKQPSSCLAHRNGNTKEHNIPFPDTRSTCRHAAPSRLAPPPAVNA